MKEMNLKYAIKVDDILKVTNGKLITGNENYECNEFCRDTREIKGGEIYIGLVGEKTNGGIFFEEALQKCASGVIIENIEINNEEKEKYKDKIIILVDNTLEAIQKIACLKWYLYKDNFPLVAITGSVGKTITKDMIYNVINQFYKKLKT